MAHGGISRLTTGAVRSKSRGPAGGTAWTETLDISAKGSCAAVVEGLSACVDDTPSLTCWSVTARAGLMSKSKRSSTTRGARSNGIVEATADQVNGRWRWCRTHHLLQCSLQDFWWRFLYHLRCFKRFFARRCDFRLCLRPH